MGALAGLALFFLTMPIASRRHAKLARRRGRVDVAAFERAMAAAAVSPTTSRYLWTQLQPHYFAPLSPMPDDRLESIIGVDRPEIDGLINHFWATMRGSDAFPLREPLGPDPSVAEFGRHLDRLVGWTVMRAA